MRPAATILLTMPGNWEGMFRIQNSTDLGSWSSESGEIEGIVSTCGEVCAGSKEPSSVKTESIVDHLSEK
jgi:hypothetical protein